MAGPVRTVLQGLGFGAGVVAAADAANLYFRNERFSEQFQSDIIFPDDLKISQNVPFMSMQFRSYKRRSIYDQPFYESQMKIVLPIPENLVDQTSVDYDKGRQLGPAAGAVVESLSGSAPGDFSEIVSRIGTAAAGIGAAGISRLARSDVASAASVLSGITVNPFQVVLFRSPEFKTHQFSWRFVPTNQGESEQIKNLIETFKYHSLPGLSALGGVFFSYPEILEVNFRPSDYYLYKFKPCVVESVSANFAPNSPSFYRSSGAPTAVQFTIRLSEIEIWTKADYLRTNGRFGNPVTPEFLRDLGRVNPTPARLPLTTPE